MRALWRVLGCLSVLFGLGLAVAVYGAAGAGSRAADTGILNQTVVHDPPGDSGSGVDLSSLTVTTYTDGTVSFEVAFANRDRLQPGETVQIFVDLNNDGNEDLNLSIWPFGDPSYLARWTGTDWATVRQLPELVEGSGSFSVRLSLSELQGDAAVPVASTIGVVVGAWPSGAGTAATDANDWLPDSRTWIQHEIQPPATTATTPTTTGRSTTPPPAASRLTVACTNGGLRATVTPAKGSKVLSVSFYANGKLVLRDTKAPYVATIKTKSGSRITIKAVIARQHGASQTLREQAQPC